MNGHLDLDRRELDRRRGAALPPGVLIGG